MVNDFLKGAASALRSLGFPIYIEEIPHNFERPCFTLRSEGTEVSPYLSGFFKETVVIGAELYMSESGESKGLEAGRNCRLGEIETDAAGLLRFIKADGRLYCAKSISSERKSQITSGNTPSNVEGLGGILFIKAEYSRFVKKRGENEEGAAMEELFENFE